MTWWSVRLHSGQRDRPCLLIGSPSPSVETSHVLVMCRPQKNAVSAKSRGLQDAEDTENGRTGRLASRKCMQSVVFYQAETRKCSPTYTEELSLSGLFSMNRAGLTGEM